MHQNCNFPRYPATVNDDVRIPPSTSPWAIDLITEQIDDMGITNDVDFDSEMGTITLTLDSLRINGPAAGQNTVTVTSNVTILTN